MSRMLQALKQIENLRDVEQSESAATASNESLASKAADEPAVGTKQANPPRGEANNAPSPKFALPSAVTRPVTRRNPDRQILPTSATLTPPETLVPSEQKRQSSQGRPLPVALGRRVWRAERPLVLPQFETSEELPSCEQLARRILEALGRRSRGAIVLLTTVDDDRGSAQTAAELADALADNTRHQSRMRRVVLVDLASRDGTLTRRYGREVDDCGGLTDVIHGKLDWRQALSHVGREKVELLPAQDTPPPAGNPRLLEILAEIREEGAVVLVEADRVDEPHTLALASHCDGIVLVVRLEETPAPVARQAVAQLAQHEERFWGCVLTRGQ